MYCVVKRRGPDRSGPILSVLSRGDITRVLRPGVRGFWCGEASRAGNGYRGGSIDVELLDGECNVGFRIAFGNCWWRVRDDGDVLIRVMYMLMILGFTAEYAHQDMQRFIDSDRTYFGMK